MNTKEVIERIFKDPATEYELTEFETLGKPIHEIINIYPKVIDSGREAGETKIEFQLLLEQAKHRVEELIEQAVQK